jgi:hypothetical protein
MVSQLMEGWVQSEDAVWVIKKASRFQQLWEVLKPVDIHGKLLPMPDVNFQQEAVLVAVEKPTSTSALAPSLAWMMRDPLVGQLMLALRRGYPLEPDNKNYGGNPWFLAVVPRTLTQQPPKLLFTRS